MEGQKTMPNLKFIHLAELDYLTRFPDVSEAPNIERSILSGCKNLVEVHESVGFLKKLVYLEIYRCNMIEIESLNTLRLIGCRSLERIPEFSSCVVKLSSLDLYFCSKIQELPSSIRYLSNLSFLKLEYCKSLENIPSSICELKCLKHICLGSCSKLQKLPDRFRSMINLENLELGYADCFNFRDLTNLCSLRKLDLSFNQIGEEDFHGNLDGLFSLEELRLTNNSKLVHFPATISRLSNLKQLQLDRCDRIQSLHSLPSRVQVLSAINCTSLEKIEDLSEEYECLNKIHLYGCNKLLEDEQSRSHLDNMLKQSFLKKRGSNISIIEKEERFENSGMHIPKLEADNITASAEAKNGMFISYIPFTSFERMDDDYNDFQLDNWSHMAEGNLVIEFPSFIKEVLRCGVHVVYKEDVKSIQQIKPSVSSYYWNYKLVQVSANYI